VEAPGADDDRRRFAGVSGPPAESALARLRRLEAERVQARRVAAEGAPPGEAPAPGSGYGRSGGIAGVLAVVGLVLLKGKGLALFLLGKLHFLWIGLKALKLSSLLTTFVSMGATIALYAGTYGGVRVAAPVVILILVHELGHGAAAWALGIRVGAPIFIPFFGAFIALKDRLRSSWQDCVIGYGGPLAGTLGGLAAMGVGRFASSAETRDLYSFVAWITLQLNLFNLTPLWTLDGARITSPVRAMDWLLGVGMLALLFLGTTAEGSRANVVLLGIVLIGAYRGYAAWRREKGAAPDTGGRLVDRLQGSAETYTHEAEVEAWQRRAAAYGYFGIVALLALLTSHLEGIVRMPGR